MSSFFEKELLNKARSGDPEAMGQILEDFRPYLRMLAQRQLDQKLQVRVDPSDVVQQTCLEASRDIPQFRGGSEGEWIKWLRQILEHNVGELIRRHAVTQKRSVNRERSMDQSRGDLPGLKHFLIGDQSTPSQRAMRSERAVELARLLDSLPADQCEALRLRYFEGFSLSQLAEALQRSEVAVAGLLKRGLQKLREAIHRTDLEQPK